MDERKMEPVSSFVRAMYWTEGCSTTKVNVKPPPSCVIPSPPVAQAFIEGGKSRSSRIPSLALATMADGGNNPTPFANLPSPSCWTCSAFFQRLQIALLMIKFNDQLFNLGHRNESSETMVEDPHICAPLVSEIDVVRKERLRRRQISQESASSNLDRVDEVKFEHWKNYGKGIEMFWSPLHEPPTPPAAKASKIFYIHFVSKSLN